jgi:hypothetical protein
MKYLLGLLGFKVLYDFEYEKLLTDLTGYADQVRYYIDQNRTIRAELRALSKKLTDSRNRCAEHENKLFELGYERE